MSLWAIDLAFDVNAMKELNYSEANAEAFGAAVEACLADRGFVREDGHGLHISSRKGALSDAYQTCLALSAIDHAERFLRRLQLYRIDETADLLPLMLAGKASTPSGESPGEMDEGISENVEASNAEPDKTLASIVVEFIRDVFLDDPATNDKAPSTEKAPFSKAG